MVARWELHYDKVPAAQSLIVEEMQQWFEQALVETVMGVQSLRNSREWTAAHIEQALSEEALTAAHAAVPRGRGAQASLGYTPEPC